MSVLVGLGPLELVLRGGGLRHPAVVAGLVDHGGVLFVPLRLRGAALHKFLTGKAMSKGLLHHSPTLEALARLRAQAKEALRVKEVVEAVIPPGEVDFADALGLGASPASSTKPKKGHIKKRWGPGPRSEASVAAEVRFQREGFEPWDVKLLLGTARAAVHMEASAANFEALRGFVLDDIARGHGAVALRQGRGGISARSPRGPKGKREYWRSDRKVWVLKEPLAGEVALEEGRDTAGPKGTRKFRTLIRRTSEETPPARRRRGRSAAQGGVLVAGVPDCLSGFDF